MQTFLHSFYRLFVIFLSPSSKVISCVPQCDVLFSCLFLLFYCLCCELRQFGSVEPALWYMEFLLFNRRNWSKLMSIGPGLWTETQVYCIASTYQWLPADDWNNHALRNLLVVLASLAPNQKANSIFYFYLKNLRTFCILCTKCRKNIQYRSQKQIHFKFG